MKKVPRGTKPAGPQAYPILFRAAMVKATEAGAKDTTRRIIKASNSILTYGPFSGLDLEAARALPAPGTLAVPCIYPRKQFRAGVTDDMQRRIVEVRPRVQVGDFFWQKAGRFGSRAKSTATYEVLGVEVRRLQDMTDADAVREGVAHVHVPTNFPLHARAPRGIFAWLWDSINGKGSWSKNPWVWVYRYQFIPENIDTVLAACEATKKPLVPAIPPAHSRLCSYWTFGLGGKPGICNCGAHSQEIKRMENCQPMPPLDKLRDLS